MFLFIFGWTFTTLGIILSLIGGRIERKILLKKLHEWMSVFSNFPCVVACFEFV